MDKLNIYQKVQKCRVELQQLNLKKSGNNKFANFTYYELADFIPKVNELFYKYNLFSQFTLEKESARLTIIDSESDKIIEFTMPTAELEIRGSNAIQSLGGINTYLKRYLYLNLLEIVEPDTFDATSCKEQEVKTKEEAENYVMKFGKHANKTLGQIFKEDKKYLDWLLYNEKTDKKIKDCIELITGQQKLSEQEQQEVLNLMAELNGLMIEKEHNWDNLLKFYKVESSSEMTLEQLRDAVKKVRG